MLTSHQPHVRQHPEVALDVFDSLLEVLLGRIVQVDLVSRHREVLGDPVSHQAGADDGYLLDLVNFQRPLLSRDFPYPAAWTQAPHHLRREQL